MFKYIKSFFTALNANANPGDIGYAVAAGFALALLPRNNLMWPLLFILFLFIRMNKGAFFLSLILLSFVTPLTDPLLDTVGALVLGASPLKGIFTVLYETPFVGLTLFNNTIVCGALVTALILFFPIDLLFVLLVKIYRNKLQHVIVSSKIYSVIVNLPLIKQIISAPDIGGISK